MSDGFDVRIPSSRCACHTYRPSAKARRTLCFTDTVTTHPEQPLCGLGRLSPPCGRSMPACRRYDNPEIALNCGSMLRDCIRSQRVTECAHHPHSMHSKGSLLRSEVLMKPR